MIDCLGLVKISFLSILFDITACTISHLQRIIINQQKQIFSSINNNSPNQSLNLHDAIPTQYTINTLLYLREGILHLLLPSKSYWDQLQQIDMSVFFNIGRSTKLDFVEINCEFVSVKELKALISSKTGVGVNDLKVTNVISGVQYAPNEYIKRGSNVSVEIFAKNLADEPLRFHEIITNERLETMLEDCRFYIVKSSNEDNIQKARDCSVWATTFTNQDKFKTAFHCFKHVLILFATNRSYELKGLARMESEPDKIPDKSIWSGVSNIRLGGNFKLRWIRKKPLSLATIEKRLGAQAKDEILKATDGSEPEPEIAKKVAMLFQLPSEPYYKPEDLIEAPKDQKGQLMNRNILNVVRNVNMQMAAWAMNLQATLENPNIDTIGLARVDFPLPPRQEQKQEQKRQKISKKKSKKDKKKKKRKYSQSSSSSSSSSKSRSRSRSRSAQNGKKRQNVSSMQKNTSR